MMNRVLTGLGRMFPRTFNEWFGVVMAAGVIPGLWVLNHWLNLPEQAVGATILAWGNILQFFYRKAKSNGGT